MGLLSGWPFQSKAEMEREVQNFEKRVFPFGLEQREAALAVLQEGLSGKLDDKEKLFSFISTKDACMQFGGEEEEGLEKAKETLGKQKWVPLADREFILMFLRLEMRATSLEDYPTVKQVQEALAFEKNR